MAFFSVRYVHLMSATFSLGFKKALFQFTNIIIQLIDFDNKILARQPQKNFMGYNFCNRNIRKMKFLFCPKKLICFGN